MSKITLTHPILGDKDFDAKHADRILSSRIGRGWTIKENEKAVRRSRSLKDQDENQEPVNGVTDKGTGQEAAESGHDTTGD